MCVLLIFLCNGVGANYDRLVLENLQPTFRKIDTILSFATPTVSMSLLLI